MELRRGFLSRGCCRLLECRAFSLAVHSALGVCGTTLLAEAARSEVISAISGPQRDPSSLRETVVPEDFFIAGEPDSTRMIQRALNALGVTAKSVMFPETSKYSVSETLAVRGKDGFRVHGAGVITQTAENKPILLLTTCNRFEVTGVSLVGKGTDFNPSGDTSFGEGIRIESCADFTIAGGTFRNFGYAAIRIRGGCSRFRISDNRMQGTHTVSRSVVNGDNYQMGVIVQSGAKLASPCSDFHISRNDISHSAHGVRVEPGCTAYRLEQNLVHDIVGQHGFYLNGTNFVILGNVLRRIAKTGIKTQCFQGGAASEGIRGVVITGNSVIECESGISVEKTSKTAPDARDVSITSNNVDGATSVGYGIYVADCMGLAISGNTIRGGAHGVICAPTSGRGASGQVLDNKVTDSQWAAFSVCVSESLDLTNNTVTRPCLAGLSGDAQSSAFYVVSSSPSHRVRISGNKLNLGTTPGPRFGLRARNVELRLGDNDFSGKPLDIGLSVRRV
jgi:hypothetical protein